MDHGDLVKIGGLWESTTKDGNTMLSGSFGAARILVLRNAFKAKDGAAAPDFHVFVTVATPKAGRKNGAREPETPDAM